MKKVLLALSFVFSMTAVAHAEVSTNPTVKDLEKIVDMMKSTHWTQDLEIISIKKTHENSFAILMKYTVDGAMICEVSQSSSFDFGGGPLYVDPSSIKVVSCPQ